MAYEMRPQLKEDVYGNRPNYGLTNEQLEVIRAVKRPQLQEDLYLGMTGQDSIARSLEPRRQPLRFMD